MKFKTQFNSSEFPRQWEKGGGVSMTVPDQALTIPQIMERNRRGLSIPQAKETHYTHSDDGEGLVPGADMPDIRNLDLAEIQEMKAQAALQVQQLQLKLQEENEAAQAAAAATAAAAAASSEPTTAPVTT